MTGNLAPYRVALFQNGSFSAFYSFAFFAFALTCSAEKLERLNLQMNFLWFARITDEDGGHFFGEPDLSGGYHRISKDRFIDEECVAKSATTDRAHDVAGSLCLKKCTCL